MNWEKKKWDITNKKQKSTYSHKHSLPSQKQYHDTYVHVHTINILKANLPILHPVLTLSPFSRGADKDMLTPHFVFLFSSSVSSLRAQSPQVLSKEDTSWVGKGAGQQR